MSSGRIGTVGAGLRDADPFATPSDDYRRSVDFQSLTGVAITRMWNGDWFYAVDTTAASRTVNLPNVADEVGHHHIVKRLTGGANECNIVTDAGLLEASATHSIATQYDLRVYFSDGDVYRLLQSPASMFATTAHNHDASSVSFSAGGTVAATNVQDAIDELGTEKAALAGAGFTGTVSFAAAVSFAAGVTMASTLGVSATLSAAVAVAVISGSNDVRMTGDGGIEIAKSAGGAYIDFKNSAAEDYDVRISQATTQNAILIDNAGGNNNVLQVFATNASGYTGAIFQPVANQAGGSTYFFIVATSDADGTPDSEFYVRGDGLVAGDGAAYNTPADYGEYRETWDGQDIPVGLTVVLDGAKVRATQAGDNPADVIGVVRPKSGAATLATNAAGLRWTGRYLKDPYGDYIRSKDGERIQSRDFKPDLDPVTKLQRYTPRSARPEWVLVGMLGAVAVNKGQLIGDRWRKMRDITPEVEEWHIR